MCKVEYSVLHKKKGQKLALLPFSLRLLRQSNLDLDFGCAQFIESRLIA
jgi:hypothetical protein